MWISVCVRERPRESRHEFTPSYTSLSLPQAGSSVTVSKVSDREFVLSSKTLGAPHQAGQTTNITIMGTSSGETKPNGCAYVNGLNDDVCTHLRMTSTKANTSLPAVPKTVFSMSAPNVDINPPGWQSIPY